jgi:LacI family transcriptional regulator
MSVSPKRTIYDVASEAGVAISTVSRVLNGSPDVAPSTRARVEAAIEKLQFRPKRVARSLAQQQTCTLAVAMPSFTSIFYVEILKGVKDTLREEDIDLLLCNLGSVNPYATLYRFLQQGAVDALMLASLPVDEPLERELDKLRAPVLLLGTPHDRFDHLCWDDLHGTEEAVGHLIEMGHTRIGMITAQPWSYNADVRVRGYRQALLAAGIQYQPELVVCGETQKHAGFSEEAGYEGMQKLLALPQSPTAVFATSDVKAYGAWAATRDAGLSIPEDIALVGYDNLKLSRYLGLTTVDQQMYDVGVRATKRLLAELHDDLDEPMMEVIRPELIVRRSSGGTQIPRVSSGA